MFGRLKTEKKASEIIKYIMEPFLATQRDQFKVQLQIHKAHVVMLGEEKILSKEETREILLSLIELEKSGEASFDLKPDTDLYMNTEEYIIQKTSGIGGKMHIGRSRNDLYACTTRMCNRSKIIDLTADIIKLQKVILCRAEEHCETVMPGYTHSQHAEPITFGHYLLAVFDSLSRDVMRLHNAYSSTNLNPLGAAALASTSFMINRRRTTELLGFRKLIENSYDAVASRDFLAETVSAVTILASNIARVVDSLIIWSTSEFAFVDLPDQYGYTSSIMPQKKNPGYFLESIRSKSARVIGDLVGTLCTIKGTPFGHCRDISVEIFIPVFNALEEATGMVKVLCGIIEALIVNRERMYQLSKEGFSGATEIANFMVRDKGLTYRSAYQIMATLVRKAFETELHYSKVTPEIIDSVAVEVIGSPVGLSLKQVRQAMDPAKNVRMKKVTGGPAPREVKRMIRQRQKEIQQSLTLLSEKKEMLKKSETKLNLAVQGYIESRHFKVSKDND